MKKYQLKKQYRIVVAVLLLAITALVPLASFAGPAYAANGEAVDVTAQEGTQTMYYLKLPTKNKKFYMIDYSGVISNDFVRPQVRPTRFIPWAWADVASAMDNRVHTFIFTYNNVTVNNFPVLTSWNIQAKVTHHGDNLFVTRYFEFTILEDVEINIRSEYYQLFQGADFKNVSVTFFALAKGFKMHSAQNINASSHNFTGATLEQREVPPDYDPIEAEGQAPDNGGIVMTPDIVEGVRGFFDKIGGVISGFFDNLFGSFGKAFGLIFLIVGVMIVLSFISRSREKR